MVETQANGQQLRSRGTAPTATLSTITKPGRGKTTNTKKKNSSKALSSKSIAGSERAQTRTDEVNMAGSEENNEAETPRQYNQEEAEEQIDELLGGEEDEEGKEPERLLKGSSQLEDQNESTVNDSISGSEVIWPPTTRSRRLIATHVELPARRTEPPTRSTRHQPDTQRTPVHRRGSRERVHGSRSDTRESESKEALPAGAALATIAEEEEDEEREREPEAMYEDHEEDQADRGGGLNVEAALQAIYSDDSDSGSDYSERQREIRKQQVRRGKEPESEEEEEEDGDDREEEEEEEDRNSKRGKGRVREAARRPSRTSGTRKKPTVTSRSPLSAEAKKSADKARSQTHDHLEEPRDGEAEDEDNIADEGVTYLGGPLPQWAKDEADALQAEYKANIHDIAMRAKKPDCAIYRHLKAVDQDPDFRGTSPWNAFLAWYNVEGDEKREEDCSIQDWNRYVSTLYNAELDARLDEVQCQDPESIREAMAEFIEWADRRFGVYVDNMKRNEPKKFEKKLTNLAGPFIQLANKVYEEWGVHAFGYILNAEYDGTVSGPGFAWGASPQYLLVKEKCQAQITRTLKDFTTQFRHIQMTEMEDKVVDVELCANLDRKPGESAKERDRRLLALFIRTDADRLLGAKHGVAIDSFVNKVFAKKLVIRNWPVGVSVPGANDVSLKNLNTQELRSVVGSREEHLRLLMVGREGEATKPFIQLERWSKDEQDLTMMSQRNLPIVSYADEDQTTAVRAEHSFWFRQALIANAGESNEEGEAAPEVRPVATTRPRNGKNKAPAVSQLSLYDDDDEEAPVAPPPRQQSVTHVPAQRREVVMSQSVQRRSVTVLDRQPAPHQRPPAISQCPIVVTPPQRRPGRIIAPSADNPLPQPHTTRTAGSPNRHVLRQDAHRGRSRHSVNPTALLPQRAEPVVTAASPPPSPSRRSVDPAAVPWPASSHRLFSPASPVFHSSLNIPPLAFKSQSSLGPSVHCPTPPIQPPFVQQPSRIASTIPEHGYELDQATIQREFAEYQACEEAAKEAAEEARQRQLLEQQQQAEESRQFWGAILEGPPSKKRRLELSPSPSPAQPLCPTKPLPSRARAQLFGSSEKPPDVRSTTPALGPKLMHKANNNTVTGPSTANSNVPTMISRRPAQVMANAVAGPSDSRSSHPVMVSRPPAQKSHNLGHVDLRQHHKGAGSKRHYLG
ncbi:hypothetical protein V5O48_012039 [Marasmius crinis-equi]|uniref:Uncharacterized protein n=1 Tax=Marasmius crinis-equi TaxID=585013 RepID=A0ABR3F4D1_9AGAR